MSTEVLAPVRKFRRTIPEAHRGSLDTRLMWLWHQRFGTVQTIYGETSDPLDKTACTLILQAIMGEDLASIKLLLQRIEGGPVVDEDVLAAQAAEPTSMRV